MTDRLIERLLFATTIAAQAFEIFRCITCKVTEPSRCPMLLKIETNFRAFTYWKVADHCDCMSNGLNRASPCFSIDDWTWLVISSNSEYVAILFYFNCQIPNVYWYFFWIATYLIADLDYILKVTLTRCSSPFERLCKVVPWSKWQRYKCQPRYIYKRPQRFHRSHETTIACHQYNAYLRLVNVLFISFLDKLVSVISFFCYQNIENMAKNMNSLGFKLLVECSLVFWLL